jgi:hypothetical protein
MFPFIRGRKAAALAATLALMLGLVGVLLLRPGADDEPDLSMGAAQLGTTTTTTAAAGTATTAAGPTTTSGPGEPAGPTSVPATAAPAGLAGPVTTVRPNATVPPGTPIAAGGGAKLVLSTTSIDYERSRTLSTLSITNQGDAPLSWSVASVGPSGFSAFPTSGTVEPGSRNDTRVAFSRTSLPEGPIEGTLQITSNGGGASVDLRGTVARPPVIDAQAGSDTLGRAPCSARPTTTSVRATITDEAGVASVSLFGRNANGASTGPLPMTAAGGSSWTGQLGPFTVPGVAHWFVIATDALGNVGRMGEVAITVEDC